MQVHARQESSAPAGTSDALLMNSEIHCLFVLSAISGPSPGTLQRSPSKRMASLVSTSSANSRSMLMRLMNCNRLRPKGVRT